MAERIYLAMTASEFAAAPSLPRKTAWMACHFSPYGTGLSNLPRHLPENSLLILNDRVPLSGHDSGRIARQLKQCCEENRCSGLLLDFQRPEDPGIRDLAAALLSQDLPCPAVLSDVCAGNFSCPVFLSPCPHHIPLQEHAAPWQGRELWLDLALDAESITLTEAGSAVTSLPPGARPLEGHRDLQLHCHYAITNGPDYSRFTLWRTREDLEALMQEAQTLDIHTFVGLYQEWT